MPVHTLSPQEIGKPLSHELVLVMPIYNEEANIRAVLKEWAEVVSQQTNDWVFVLINDGSQDGTLNILCEFESAAPDQYVIINKPNSGHGNSCRVGYDIACSGNCQWVFQIDSDGQCDPSYFSKFWDLRGDVDCIFGIRKSRDDGQARVLTSQICRWGSSLVCGADLKDPNVPYRMLRARILKEALAYIPPSFNIHNVAITFVLKKMPSISWKHVPIHFRDRQGGSNSINLLNVAQYGVDMLLELWKLKQKLTEK